MPRHRECADGAQKWQNIEWLNEYEPNGNAVKLRRTTNVNFREISLWQAARTEKANACVATRKHEHKHTHTHAHTASDDDDNDEQITRIYEKNAFILPICSVGAHF